MMKLIRTLLAALALIAVLGITTQQRAAAQGNATIQARATIQAALTVTAARDLNFGTVTAGIPGGFAVGVTTPAAGQWNMTGEGNLGVSLTFMLPSELTGTGTPVPISGWQALASPSSTPSGTPFTPTSGTAVSKFLSGGALWVFIGAIITPPVGSSGNYSAPIMLTVAYL